jgi:hypothetical protein
VASRGANDEDKDRWKAGREESQGAGHSIKIGRWTGVCEGSWGGRIVQGWMVVHLYRKARGAVLEGEMLRPKKRRATTTETDSIRAWPCGRKGDPIFACFFENKETISCRRKSGQGGVAGRERC